MWCPKCNATLTPGTAICPACGASTAETTAGERRQVTVVFCDIVGWSEIAERLDLEDAGDVLRSYHEACARAVAHEGGHVAQFLGDGVMIYFGYPEAHEDDPRRAIRAALSILDVVKGAPNERLTRSAGTPLRVRLGVHTGLTVVGPSYGLAVGSVPNLAARLQELATPDSVVVSEATHRLLGGRFVSTPLGPRALKGFDHPVGVYQIDDEQPASMPPVSSGARANAPAPFVGREAELTRLTELWQEVLTGGSHSVLVIGDAGIGKTRLISRFVEHCTAPGSIASWLHAQGSPTHQNTPFRPLLDLLDQLSHPANDAAESRAGAKAGPAREDIALLLSLLEPARPGAGSNDSGLTMLDPMRLARVTRAFGELIVGCTMRGPLIVVVEDVHWIDPSTRDVVAALGDLPSVLWLLTTRPGSSHSNDKAPARTELVLDRLSSEQSAVIVHWLAGGAASASLVSTVLNSTDGVPLFVEEQTKMLLESAGSETESMEIAASLQASLLARLDRLGEAKRVAQFGSVVGRSVSLSMLERGLHLSPVALQAALASLVAAGVLLAQSQTSLARDALLPESFAKRQSSSGAQLYTFKHALVQEAAYQSLLRSDRRRYHGIVASSMEQAEPALAERQPEVLAYHFAQAQDLSRAARYAHTAGRRSMAAAAYREGREHLRNALSHCQGVSESEERRRLELQILSLLGICLITTEGYGSAEVKATFDRARELARGQEMADTFHVLRGLWAFFSVVPDFPRARALGVELEQLAHQSGDAALVGELGPVLGLPALWCGELDVARRHFEDCVAACGGDRDGAQVLFSEDPAVTALALLGWVYWLEGDSEKARATGNRAIEFAKRIGHAHSQAYAMAFTSVLAFFLRDERAAAELTQELEALCTEYEFPTWLAVGHMVRGWALARTGDAQAALPLVEQSFALWDQVGVGLNRPQRLGLRAEVKALCGDVPGALEDVNEGLATGGRTGDHYYDAELWRLRGEFEIGIDPGATTSARACFETAIAIARGQGARELVLRAERSLGELASG
jgi:class 3 adenylate cyclase/tetratricopeptide (TPR) repeat protein